MIGVAEGFVTIGVVIGVGYLLGRFNILTAPSQQVLARLVFYVASPALMIIVLGGTDLSTIFSANLIASITSVVVVAVLWILMARLVWRRDAGDTAIGTFCAGYVNAGNLGLPIAGYVLGDVSLVAPMLLTQLILLQPAGLAVLDVVTSTKKVSAARLLTPPVADAVDRRFGARRTDLGLRRPAARAGERPAHPARQPRHPGHADRVRRVPLFRSGAALLEGRIMLLGLAG